MQMVSSYLSRVNPYVHQHPFSRLFSNKLTRGDVVLLKVNFENSEGHVVQSKNRPFIIISSDKVMEITKRVALAPLSSAPARLKHEVVIPIDEETGIHVPSKVMSNQVRTISLEKNELKKIGSAFQYMTEVNQALKLCFGNFRKNQKLAISRGDVVEIDLGAYILSGIIVSNDIGNEASQIAMLAHSRQKNEVMNEFDLVVKKESNKQEELLVQCYMIDTLDQHRMSKKDQITDTDMERITAMLFKVLGIKE